MEGLRADQEQERPAGQGELFPEEEEATAPIPLNGAN
jgi:hypothetical protein